MLRPEPWCSRDRLPVVSLSDLTAPPVSLIAFRRRPIWPVPSGLSSAPTPLIRAAGSVSSILARPIFLLGFIARYSLKLSVPTRRKTRLFTDGNNYFRRDFAFPLLSDASTLR